MQSKVSAGLLDHRGNPPEQGCGPVPNSTAVRIAQHQPPVAHCAMS